MSFPSSDPAAITHVGHRLSLDQGWRFHLGDVPMPELKGLMDCYENAKAGRAWGAAAPDYDDSEWRTLDLPHDWAVEGPFDKDFCLAQGFRPRGIGWYRRYIRLDESDKGKSLELQFDGISTHATVWVNGLLVHRNFCGYTPFHIDLTPLLTFGDQLNCIAVRVDASAMEGWWYEGAGIYRHTWLAKRSPVHVVTDGVFANPIRDGNGMWSIPVEVTLGNIGQTPGIAGLTVELLNPEGVVEQSEQSEASVPPLGTGLARISFNLGSSPRLWSLDTPVLYTVKVSISLDGKLCDIQSVRCGFRTIRFDPDKGFFLNDRPLKLQGTCNHQDHAGVGVAVPDSLWDFRVRKLKEMGSNAYRSAHNPPAREFLDACDRLGMLVMDENRNFNYTPEYLGQLRAMLKRDRNHPCVILWSVFNEEPMQGTEQGREMVRRMVAEVRRWDTTRPVTAALNGGMMNEHGVFEAVDVMGFNYVDGFYDSFHEKHPNLPITSSEDTSAYMTRGEFENDPVRNVISSYDTEAAPWGQTHREAWKRIAERPFLAGGFVWTGFDYRGEPQRLVWPSVSSVFGIMDVCGFPKTAFYIHQSQWIKDRPILALAPHWNWPGKEGQPVKVIAMTNADTVHLWLNGDSLGEIPVPAYDYAEWLVPYAPGKLEAVAFKDGKEVAREIVETAGEPVALELVPDRHSLLGDGRDAMPVTIRAVDQQGRVVPRADALVTFTLHGEGRILGHGNGDHNCHDPEQGPTRRLFHGLAQVIVQSGMNRSGNLTLHASSPGLGTAETTLTLVGTGPPPALPPADPVFFLNQWRMSPPSLDYPDPHQEMSEADMNTWTRITPGSAQKLNPGESALYRVLFTPWTKIQKNGGMISLAKIAGRAHLWLNGECVAQKDNDACGDLIVPLPPSSEKQNLTLILQAGEKGQTGLLGSATILSV
jgi:beta-galactosidase